jgi:hypothetical protein
MKKQFLAIQGIALITELHEYELNEDPNRIDLADVLGNLFIMMELLAFHWDAETTSDIFLTPDTKSITYYIDQTLCDVDNAHNILLTLCVKRWQELDTKTRGLKTNAKHLLEVYQTKGTFANRIRSR